MSTPIRVRGVELYRPEALLFIQKEGEDLLNVHLIGGMGGHICKDDSQSLILRMGLVQLTWQNLPVWVNPIAVVAVKVQDRLHTSTLLAFACGNTLEVQESQEEVRDRLFQL
jgi:hypothetical protein